MERRLGKRPYHDFRDALASYWRLYGGWSAFLRSPFTHAALLLDGCCFPIWSQHTWPDVVLVYVPSLLGFTLAGYALVFAFGDDLFRKIMAGSNAKADDPVFYEHLSATYLHFVLVQAAGLMLAVIAKADVGRVGFAWIAPNCVGVEKAHDVFRFVGLILAGLAFFPSALALTNAVAAALVINSVIGLYVKLWHTAPIVDESVREKTEV